ncbi:hypothetical protein BRD02_06960 [Halobacteriales archaeon QS_8_69_73]|nr:MAG: hypothetical protein BRD02_06960 [Halobacteriales archaeon QS_8_69_73]
MVIGSLLIFTVLIVAFSGYQAFAVPDQNAEVEAEHFQTVEDQFARLQGGVVNAVGDTDVRSTSITLGTQYPSRAFALNPPPAAGRLETTAPGDVNFDKSNNVCRADGTATTRSLVYTPGYNEFREPQAVGYESRVLSREFESGTRYDQRLVRSGGGTDEINLFLLTGSVDENGVSSYSLELNGSNRHTTTLTDPTITLPSRFDAATWEDEILADRSDVNATDDDDQVKLNFTGGNYRVSCAVIGLDGDPAFSPPSDVDTGTDGDAAYSTEWLDPSSEPGTSPSCSDAQCTLDASVSKTLGLTAETTPAAEDATISFSASNSTVGTVAPATNETGSDGRALTRMRARSNGTMKVYAASGGSGDVIDVTVTDFPALRAAAVFTDSDGNVTTAEQATGENTLAAKADVLGPLVSDIDGDGSDDIPYVSTGGTVHIVNPDGTDKTELSSNNVKVSTSLLGVGRWDGADTSVYFADGDESIIYRTNPSEGEVQVVNPGGVSAVAGPADINGSDANELVYVGSSQKLKYLEPGAEPGGNEGIVIYDQVGSSVGLGRPADFNGNGTARIPMVDGSGNLLLVDSNGNGPELDTGVDKAPVAAVDWDDDGELEVMYLKGGELKYIDDVTGGQIKKDTEIDNADTATGVT